MRSTLFQAPTQDILLNRILSQCSFHGANSTVCTSTLKMLLLALQRSKDPDIKNEANALLTLLINEGIYSLRDGNLQLLRFNIPTENMPLVDEIEAALRKVNDILYPRSTSRLEMFEME
jgi:hypothetical protein